MNLEEKLNQKKNEIGLVGTRLNFLRPREGKGISEHITHTWDEIVIQIKKGLNLAPDEETKAYLRKLRIQDPVEAVATDLLYHGCGHRELPINTQLGCPFTIQYHDQILNGVTRALQEKGKQGLEAYVTNAFEDVIDNVNARKHTRHSGQILFWNNEAIENQGKFQAFYEAFVKLNLTLWGASEDATLLRRFFANTPEIAKAIAQYKQVLKSTLRTSTLLRLFERERPFAQLFNQAHWEHLAYQFAYATADLLDDQKKMRLCFGSSDETTWDKQMKLPQTQEELVFGRYKAGTGLSAHTDPLLQLDALYRKISRAIPVKTTSFTEATTIPIVHFGRENISDEGLRSGQKIKGIGFTEEGELTLKVSRHTINHPVTYKVHPRDFPKLKVTLLDTSGSMALSPNEDENIGDTSCIPWGDNSKYHYALQGLYGIDNFLERQGIAPYVQCESIVFSGETTTTGRQRFRSEAERRALLRKPSGGTTLNLKILQDALREKCFMISVSDGDISGWGSVREQFQQVVQGNDYVYIHIGQKNEFTKDLEKWGIPVQYVTGNEDLTRLMIDVAAKYYKGEK